MLTLPGYLQADCCGGQEEENTSKLDIVIGCSVGSPAVYMTAIIARKVNCLIKVKLAFLRNIQSVK